MMRAALCIAALCCPGIANADVIDAQRDAIFAQAEVFRSAILNGAAMDVTIAASYPPLSQAIADEFNIASVDDLHDRMRQGYAYSASLLQMVKTDMHLENARFGQSGDWVWGIMPYSSTARWVDSGEMLDLQCAALLVFGQSEEWFLHTLERKPDVFLRQALPDVAIMIDPRPTCQTGTS